MMTRTSIIAALAACPGMALANVTLDVAPGAVITTERSENYDSYFMALAPYANGAIDGVQTEGQFVQQAWKIPQSGHTTLQILAPLREQLVEAGFDILFECEARGCGGFDFRYQTDILPEPEMHIDLGDFRYLAAESNAGSTPVYVTLMVSRSATAGFVQVTRVGGEADEQPRVIASTKAPPQIDGIDLDAPPIADRLEAEGRSTLDDLLFRTGSSDLDNADFQSLIELAAYLKDNPTRSIVLVGHTDAEGALTANIALSRKRAEAVASRLIEEYQVAPNQVSADGVGFLAPRASNLTEDGRTQNRRVEVILSSTR